MSDATDALFQACFERDIPGIRDALARGADPNDTDHEGQRPAHALLFLDAPVDQWARLDAVMAEGLGLLLDHGARPDRTNRKGLSVYDTIDGKLPRCAQTCLKHLGGRRHTVAQQLAWAIGHLDGRSDRNGWWAAQASRLTHQDLEVVVPFAPSDKPVARPRF